MNQNNLGFVMKPGYITGLTQTDGTFFCTVSMSANHLFGLQFRPQFAITCDLDSSYVLEAIKLYFNCGNIYINKKSQSAEYVVSSLTDLVTIIIPQFKDHPLFCGKLHAFQLFSKITLALFGKKK